MRNLSGPTSQQAPGPVASQARLADRRGLTAAGAVLLTLVLGGAGVAYDVVTGSGLRAVFAVCFVASSALAALLVHREDLRATIVMPPLLYVALALFGGVVDTSSAGGAMPVRAALGLLNALLLGAPVLVAATAAAVVVAAVRAMRGRTG